MNTQKRIASKILKVGITRVWIDPEAEDVSEAMTRGDVRKFIGLGLIKAKPKKGNSRGRVRKRIAQKKKGRGGGFGKRKGPKTARSTRKEQWMQRVRAQRKILRHMRDSKKITIEQYRKAYSRASAGTLKTKAHVLNYLKESKK